MHLDHVGIATPDRGSLTEQFGAVFDVTVVHEERHDGIDITFLDADNATLELLEPVGEDGPIDTFLTENGPGIHHLAFVVTDVGGTIERARSAGIEPIDKTPREGARGHRVAFLHPRDTGGVLLELVES